MTNPPCHFFLRGACKRGASCRYRHGVASEVPLIEHQDNRANIICTFFRRGTCTKGEGCVFSHDLSAAKPSMTAYPIVEDASNVIISPTATGLDTSIWSIGINTRSKLPVNQTMNSRVMGGATVEFGEGAVVSTVSLSSDCSAVSLSHLPQHVSVQDILDLLASYGFVHISPDSVHLTRLPQMSHQLAQIKVTDANFASHFLERTGHAVDFSGSIVPIVALQLGGESESGTNRLQLASVSCTWYNPSKVAYIQYAKDDNVREVLAKMQSSSRLLDGRKLNITHQQGQSLQIGNLDLATSMNAIKRFLPQPPPQKISWGARSHVMDSEGLERHVKASLKKRGTLLDWLVSSPTGGSRIKAIAKFTDPEAARLAVKELNDTPIDARSTDKLRVAPIAIRHQLDALADRSWRSDYVSIKKVFGQNKDLVARVKSSVEKLLAGHIAENEKVPISSSFFFKDTNIPFLENIMGIHGVTIIRDFRKMVLRLYGDPSSIRAAQAALAAKASEVTIQSHMIILDPAALNIALTGGFRLLVASLGKDNVKMDITSNPKRIVVSGSEQRLAQAEKARTAALFINAEEEELCPTRCGHTYCNSCLASQCISASETDFPIRCLELREALTSNDYERVLQTSLTGHIRSRPTEFQYCPTPDCDRFYRSSSTSNPRIFDCDGCLSSICSGCHHVTHDVRAAHDGEKEFNEWKKENDARDCPKCKTVIEKTYGCNHMECKACGIHICWACMDTFGSGGETYAHMSKSHSDGFF
ncbi:hypothetical protein K505DRAFT_347196 [Melanomma pulvis-pyrius CBS 109.77]|uniref:RBR-type E3 ubiquitin transferase n=1 Tax=Melanomma pulvis-pyrius CBS 109.77 TaxID=1314802 RepID=A0A6A6XNP0_9PLEO|nr:hypothetical protein K505DRAFT_347196 [Melanomma pulvis-pyrius CBS 109.77]